MGVAVHVAVRVPLGNPATVSGWATWSNSVAVATVTTGFVNRYATGRSRVGSPGAVVLRLLADWPNPPGFRKRRPGVR